MFRKDGGFRVLGYSIADLGLRIADWWYRFALSFLNEEQVSGLFDFGFGIADFGFKVFCQFKNETS